MSLNSEKIKAKIKKKKNIHRNFFGLELEKKIRLRGARPEFFCLTTREARSLN